MAIENRELAAGTKLIAKYKGEHWRLEVLPGEPKTYGFVGKRPKDAAQVYKSPSSAGSAVMGGTACNGWRFWSVEGATEVKTTAATKTTTKKASTKKATRKPRAQAKPAVLQRHKNQKDLEEGQPDGCAAPASSTSSSMATPLPKPAPKATATTTRS